MSNVIQGTFGLGRTREQTLVVVRETLDLCCPSLSVTSREQLVVAITDLAFALTDKPALKPISATFDWTSSSQSTISDEDKKRLGVAVIAHTQAVLDQQANATLSHAMHTVFSTLPHLLNIASQP